MIFQKSSGGKTNKIIQQPDQKKEKTKLLSFYRLNSQIPHIKYKILMEKDLFQGCSHIMDEEGQRQKTIKSLISSDDLGSKRIDSGKTIMEGSSTYSVFAFQTLPPKIEVKEGEISMRVQPKSNNKKELDSYQEYEKSEIHEEIPNLKTQNKKTSEKLSRNVLKNILPNTINRIISFLSCRTKSQKIIVNFLSIHPLFKKIVTPQRYYTYIKMLKNEMHKCLLEDNVDKLFQYYDLSFQIFTKNQQTIFIRINIVLMKYFARNSNYFTTLVYSKRVWRSTIYEYLQATRSVLERVEFNLAKIQGKSQKK